MKTIKIILLLMPSLIQAQWEGVPNIPKSSPIMSLYADKNFAIAGVDSVIYLTDDGGLTWIQSGKINNESDVVNAIIRHNNRIFLGTYSHGVYESQDGGKTFQQMSSGLLGLGSQTISCFAVRGDSIYVGTMGAGIFVMNLNNSNQWFPFSDGLLSNVSYTIYSLVNIEGTLFAGAGTGGYLYKNFVRTSLWQEQLIDTTNFMVIFDIKTSNNTLLISASPGLLSSSDGGNIFSCAEHFRGSIGGSEIILNGDEMFVFYRKPNRTYWYYSTDNGATIKFYEEQLNTDVMSSAIIGNKLYAARLEGLWYRNLPVTTVDEETQEFEYALYQNYPNPFNPKTKIKYSIPLNSLVTVKIYDLLGNEVVTLVNKEITVGNHEIDFDGSNLASGIYFCKLQAGNFISTKKFILMK